MIGLIYYYFLNKKIKSNKICIFFSSYVCLENTFMGEKVRYVRNARRHETNKDVPIITQKNLGPKEFRELRKFLKTASSEELREWLLRLKEANEDYTQRKFLENSKELVQAKKDAENRLKDFREVAKPLIDYSRKSFFYRLTHKPPLV